ncbi:MAG: hypothetical protein D6712_20520, partial [Chloroflexi bacterium]
MNASFAKYDDANKGLAMQTIRRLLILLPALWLVLVAQAAPIRQSTPFEIFLLNIRLDLEQLADDV